VEPRHFSRQIGTAITLQVTVYHMGQFVGQVTVTQHIHNGYQQSLIEVSDHNRITAARFTQAGPDVT